MSINEFGGEIAEVGSEIDKELETKSMKKVQAMEKGNEIIPRMSPLVYNLFCMMLTEMSDSCLPVFI